jgi:HNH endonuclease
VRIIVSVFKAGKNSEESIKEIVANNEFSYLALQNIAQQDEYISKDFSTNHKSAIYMREALHTAPRCKICGGFIHRNSISIDHVQRKQDGGLATLENGQLTHPYCNTGYKN